MKPRHFTLRAALSFVAIAASFLALVRSMFADSLSIIDLIPLVIVGVLVTTYFLRRAVKHGRTSALALIGTGATAAFSSIFALGIAAAGVWTACVYADDSKGFLISPWVFVFLFVATAGGIAAVLGAILGGGFHLYVKASGRRAVVASNVATHDEVVPQ